MRLQSGVVSTTVAIRVRRFRAARHFADRPAHTVVSDTIPSRVDRLSATRHFADRLDLASRADRLLM